MNSSFVFHSSRLPLLLLPCLLVACGDELLLPVSHDAGPDTGGALFDSAVGQDPTVAPADGGLTDGGGDAEAPMATAPMGLALLHNDSESSSLSLLTPTGEIVRDDCLHSGSIVPVLSRAFSQDVALPSEVQPNNAVVIIDRKHAVLTYIDPATCTVLRQINVGTGFEANPHDVVGLSPTKAYVSRYRQNLTATAAPDDFDEGNDILVFNPASGALLKRIDLLPFAVASPTNVPTLPRASRMVRVGDKVYVSLNNLSADFMDAGHGRVVVLDTNTDTVVGQIDFPTYKNCGALSRFGNNLFVACGGVFGDGDMQAAHAGIVRVALPSNEATSLGATVFGNGVVSLFTVAAMDESRVAAVTLGNKDEPQPDRIWGASFATSSAVIGFEGSKAYSLWSLVADRTRNIIWATDSGMQPALRSFTMAPNGVLTPGPTVQTSLTRKLPPKVIAWY